MRALVLIGSLCVAVPATACSFFTCAGASEVHPTKGVPANVPAFLWHHGSFGFDPAAVVLARWEADVLVDVPVAVDEKLAAIVPFGALQPGAYRLTVPSVTCAYPSNEGVAGELSVDVAVVEAAPLPTVLGSVKASDATQGGITLASSAGGCSEGREAVSSSVTLVLSAEAAPWSQALVLQTVVDGKPWTYSSSIADVSPLQWVGKGSTVLYHLCGDPLPPWLESVPVGLASGSHSVLFRAKVAGTNTWIETEPAFVTLECAPLAPSPELVEEVSTAEPEDPDTETVPEPDPSAEPQTPGVEVVEGAPTDVPEPEPSDVASDAPSAGGGCASTPSPAAPWVLVLLVAAFAGARLTRSATSTCTCTRSGRSARRGCTPRGSPRSA